ncbi:MAG: hypothetical protein KF894_00760 [Labilithrix sp.]|nr:hypothetical protein [Labilithrix sp.]
MRRRGVHVLGTTRPPARSGTRGGWRASWLVWASIGGLLGVTGACSSPEDAPAPAVDAGSDASASDGAAPSDPDGGAADADADVVAPPPPPYDFTVQCAGAPCATRIAARGGTHACVVLHGGSVRCWGANASGQLGTGRPDGGVLPPVALTPRPVEGIANAVDVAATGSGREGTTCVVSGSGDVDCFGSDAWMQLGQPSGGSTAPSPSPARVDGLQAKSVSLAGTFALAVGTDDRLWSWGTNTTLQLARDPSAPGAPPDSTAARADRLALDVRVCAGTGKTGFAVTPSGELLSWGGATLEQLGRATSLRDGDPIPARIALTEVTSVTTGAAHACALRRGELHCWGDNDRGQLGSGRRADEAFPARVVLPPDVHPVAVAAGASNTCMVAANGDVYCWGANAAGQSGTTTRQDQLLPRRIDGLTGEAIALAVMDDSACAVVRDGSVACWGSNLVGQLGQGTRDVGIHAQARPVVLE